MSVFSLIRATITENPNDSAEKIARLVAEATPAEKLMDYYVTVLESVVADQIRQHRNMVLNSKQGKSSKLEERRAWWNRVLLERVHVGEARYKTIASCTADDLAFCIEERQAQIDRLTSQISKYEAIRGAMLTHGVDTVADLPDGAVTL